MPFNWNTNVSLRTVLSNEMSVPDYQRDYAWADDEALDFYQDLMGFTRSGDQDYLFGQFIFYESGGIRYIIDGQQRIVTSTIFLSIVRNIVNGLDIDRSDDEYTMFSSTILNSIGSESVGYKLTLNGNGKVYFRDHIQKRDSAPTNGGRYRSTKNMKSVWDTLNERIRQEIEYCSDDASRFRLLSKMTRSLMDGFRISMIVTDDLAQAYTIFETLNSRGRDLEAGDLLKNFFFQSCPNDADILSERWTRMDTDLDEANTSTTQCIRCLWNSQHNFVRERGLYREVSKNLKDSGDIQSFVDTLFRLYPYYVDLCDPERATNFDESVCRIIRGLNTLNTRLYRPLIMACIRMGEDTDSVESLMESVESLIMRNIIIGPDKPNKYEGKFAEWAREVTGGTSVEEIRGRIVSLTISDDVFEAFFDKFTVKEKFARYILSEIYNHENGGEMHINDDSREVNVEHIMPKSATKWDVAEEVHDEYLHYLGNQTLLLSSDNTSASNNDFETKREVYRRSKLRQNNVYLADLSEWGPDQIKGRQRHLFEISKKRWPKYRGTEKLD